MSLRRCCCGGFFYCQRTHTASMLKPRKTALIRFQPIPGVVISLRVYKLNSGEAPCAHFSLFKRGIDPTDEYAEVFSQNYRRGDKMNTITSTVTKDQISQKANDDSYQLKIGDTTVRIRFTGEKCLTACLVNAFSAMVN